jgi:hypothetical protein
VSTSGTKPEDEIPVYEMSSFFYQTNQEKYSNQVSNLRKILESCVKFLNDKNSLWVGTEVREPPTFYGLNELEEFFNEI